MTDKRRSRCAPPSGIIPIFFLLSFVGSCVSGALRIGTLESGTVVVSINPADPDAPPAGWAVREVFHLGSAEGTDPAKAFTEIRDLDVDGEGRVYVLDGGASMIRVFGRQGKHARDIGRPLPGDGPGRVPKSFDPSDRRR